MNIDLNLLPVFHKIYTEQNLTKAASSLGLTQSAVSQALGRLRLHFEDELFFRISKGMEPTAKSHKIAPYISAALTSAEQAFYAVKDFDPRTSEEVFEIGMADIDVVFLGSKLMHYFQKKAPKIHLKLVPIESDNYLELLDRGVINIAINYIETSLPKRFATATLFYDEFVVLSKKIHPKIKKKLTLNDYLCASHLRVNWGGYEKNVIDPIISRNREKRKFALTVNHILGVPFVVKETDLLATVPLTLMEHHKEIKGLRIHDFPVKAPSFAVSLIWLQRIKGNKAYEWIVEEIKKVCGKINIDRNQIIR